MATRFPIFCLLFVGVASLGCTTTKTNVQSITLAPTAVAVPVERDHHDVLDSRAPLDRWVCLRSEERQWVSVLVELGEPNLKGTMTLFDAAGVAQGQAAIQPGRRIYELEGQAKVGSPSLCVSIRVEEGWSMYRLRWRVR